MGLIVEAADGSGRGANGGSILNLYFTFGFAGSEFMV